MQAIRKAISSARRCLVVSHYNPDPDAYGASLGLTHALRNLGKHAECLNQSGSSKRYPSMPGIEEVRADVPEGDWDLLCVVDCADFDRIGDDLGPKLPRDITVINIDHHVSNNRFGNLQYVKTDGSSSSELVFHLIEEIPHALSREVAECLLAGIYGDTGSFRYSSTGADTFLVAHKLCKLGASPHAIASELYGMVELSALKLQTTALRDVRMHCNNRVAEIVVTREMLDHCNAVIEDTDMLAERARDIAGVDVAYAIREDKDIWRVSLRSKSSEYNMSELAQRFGGGGHVSAAAFRWRKPVEELRAKLLAEVARLLGETP